MLQKKIGRCSSAVLLKGLSAVPMGYASVALDGVPRIAVNFTQNAPLCTGYLVHCSSPGCLAGAQIAVQRAQRRCCAPRDSRRTPSRRHRGIWRRVHRMASWSHQPSVDTTYSLAPFFRIELRGHSCGPNQIAQHGQMASLAAWMSPELRNREKVRKAPALRHRGRWCTCKELLTPTGTSVMLWS